MANLDALFRDAAGASPTELANQPSDLERALYAHIYAGRAAWPEIDLSESDYVRFLAERSPCGTLPSRTLAGDLWLACACAHAMPEALAAFHAQYSDLLTRVLIRRGASPAVLPDIAQSVFEKLLVARDGAPPQIVDYRGTGPLKSWVATVTVTTLLMNRRATERRRETFDSDPVVSQVVEDGPELRYLKQYYRKPVEQAIVLALTQLNDRQRVLLRLHLCERVSIDRLGAIYSVNRATAARWLVKARAELLQLARAEIRRALNISDSECDSVLNLVDSQLHVSIARHLES